MQEPINSNIGCIETNHLPKNHVKPLQINSNIGCIETQLSSSSGLPLQLINSNIGCIETSIHFTTPNHSVDD